MGNLSSRGHEKEKEDNFPENVREDHENKKQDNSSESVRGDEEKLTVDDKERCNDVISFNVLLLNTSPDGTEVRSERTLTLKNFPESVAELKLALQQEFNVPVYDQKLSFGDSVMEDNKKLEFYRIKDGDQFTVQYTETAEVKSIMSLISAFRDILKLLQTLPKQLKSNNNSTISDMQLRVKDIDSSMKTLFWGVNAGSNTKLFFSNGGLHVITELHTVLSKQPWNEIQHIDLLYLERSVLYVLSRICAEILPQQKHVILKSLNNIFGSFLRVSVSTGHITVPTNPKFAAISENEQLRLLLDVIHASLGCLCNLTEGEEYQVEVASNQDVMNQLVGCLRTPSFNHTVRIRLLCCLENLSYNSSIHKFLCTPDIINAIFRAPDLTPSPSRLDDMDPAQWSKLESDLVKYFGCMVVAQLVLTKVIIFPEKLVLNATQFLDQFLHGVDIKLLHMVATEAYHYRWQDIFPVMRLVYSPCCYSSPCQLDMLCLEAGLCGLQIILKGDRERRTLIKQGLLDYLICLPWYIAKESEAQKRAKQLVDMVGCHLPLQPPSLNNIVRAKLAVSGCGLKKAMNSNCQQLVYEVL